MHGTIVCKQTFPLLFLSIGEPNNSGDEDCTEMHVSDGLWNDNACDAHLHFICEKKGNNGADVSGDLSDPNCNSNEACCFKYECKISL